MLCSEGTTNTEAHIKNVARKVFLKKGLAGTRLQEIADEAGIGRTALHYYFRSKEKLFAEVWKDFFIEAQARMLQFNKGDLSIVEKMKLLVSNYYDNAMKTPEIDLFLLNEFNTNNTFFKEIFQSSQVNLYAEFVPAIEEAIQKGEMVGDAKQIFFSIISMCIFPFAAMSMMISVLNLTEKDFIKLMQDRKEYLMKFVETAFLPIDKRQ